jgi:alanine racemase
VECFGVANLDEARILRQAAPVTPILVMGTCLPEEHEGIVKGAFEVAVSSWDECMAYATLAKSYGTLPVRIHVAVDTGMGRMGVWQDDALGLLTALRTLQGVEVVGLATHLPSADEDNAFTVAQLATFERLCQEAEVRGCLPPIVHVHNSAGLSGYPAKSRNMVRAGLILYGIAPREELAHAVAPVLAWRCRVVSVREIGSGRGISYGRTFVSPCPMRVATLPVGYADGYPRQLSNNGAEVLIAGHRCPVLGRVTMDQIVVDISTVPDVTPGAVATLLGSDSTESVTAADMSRRAGTIPWDILTGIGNRVTRLYSHASASHLGRAPLDSDTCEA